MDKHAGDDLVNLFEKLHIETGNLNPNVIKAWFDTDSESFLNWFCSSITEENCISAQENLEYERYETKFTDDELKSEIKSIESNYPELLQCDVNVFEVECAENIIEVLEEHLKDCDNELNLNNQLKQRLSSEFSKLSSEEIKSHIVQEAAEETCLNLCRKMDEINSKSLDQILKYHIYLNNYEFAEVPGFINNVEFTEFEEKFTNTVTSLNSLMKVGDLLDSSTSKTAFISELTELQNSIFHSKISCLAVQMEVESFNYLLRFLDNYDVNAPLSFLDSDVIQLNVDLKRSEQGHMIEAIEQKSWKHAEGYINLPTLQCLKNELNFCQSRLSYLNRVKENLTKILSHYVVVYNLYLQEKLDINHFTKTVIHYMNKGLQDSIFRREAMLKVIDEYETFKNSSLEKRFKLIGSFGSFLSRSDQLPLAKIFTKSVSIKDEICKLEENKYDCINKDYQHLKNLRASMKILENFLVCGPTRQIVTISHKLLQIFSDVNLNLDNQNSCVKLLMEIIRRPKEQFSEDKWFVHRRLLWMHFITDFQKMLAILEQLKAYVTTSKDSL